MNDVEYAGLRCRAAAAILDIFLILVLIVPVSMLLFGMEDPLRPGGLGLGLQYLFTTFVVILFWQAESATLGKIAMHLKIIDARTGCKPTTTQFAVRYLSYGLSVLPCFLGVLWVAVDRRKQAWHDKLSGTVVVRSAMTGPVEIPGQFCELEPLGFGLDDRAAPVAELTSR